MRYFVYFNSIQQGLGGTADINLPEIKRITPPKIEPPESENHPQRIVGLYLYIAFQLLVFRNIPINTAPSLTVDTINGHHQQQTGLFLSKSLPKKTGIPIAISHMKAGPPTKNWGQQSSFWGTMLRNTRCLMLAVARFPMICVVIQSRNCYLNTKVVTRQGAPGLYTQLKQSDEMIGEKLTSPFVWRGSNERSEEGMRYHFLFYIRK